MIRPDELSQQLTQAPFRDIINLTETYNEKKSAWDVATDHAENNLHSELLEIEQVINKIIENIHCSNPASIRQGLVLVSCRSTDITKRLINKILQEIKSSPLHFPDLYAALTKPIASASTSIDDQLQIATRLSEDLSALHAPDIHLTCLVPH